jgi:hypothetical protein
MLIMLQVLNLNVVSVKFVVANGVHTAATTQWWRAAEQAQCMDARAKRYPDVLSGPMCRGWMLRRFRE